MHPHVSPGAWMTLSHGGRSICSTVPNSIPINTPSYTGPRVRGRGLRLLFKIASSFTVRRSASIACLPASQLVSLPPACLPVYLLLTCLASLPACLPACSTSLPLSLNICLPPFHSACLPACSLALPSCAAQSGLWGAVCDACSQMPRKKGQMGARLYS